MHITPRGVPVMHMQYFFHPERPVQTAPPWNFFDENGRSFAAHGRVSFMHKLDIELDQFDAEYRFITLNAPGGCEK
jgi:hypothetical protein